MKKVNTLVLTYFTFIMVVAGVPPPLGVMVIVALPVSFAVTIPLLSIVAIFGLSLL